MCDTHKVLIVLLEVNALVEDIVLSELQFAESGAQVDTELQIALKAVDPQEVDALVALLIY
jgi:hypothetical protein